MRQYLESDLGFYYGVGAFIIAIFIIGLAAVAIIEPDGIGTVELVGLAGGFFVFMLVYFISVSIQRLEDDENV